MNCKTSMVLIALIAVGAPLVANPDASGPGLYAGVSLAVPTYGDATVERILSADIVVGDSPSVYTFRCDIAGWPDVIGSDIAVTIDHIAPPRIVTQGGNPNRFFQLQVSQFIDKALRSADKIRLENIKRGPTFSLVAEVIVDSNSLATLLMDSDLASYFLGEVTDIAAVQTVAASSGSAIDALPAAQTGGAVSLSSYIASKSSKIFHRPTCRYAKTMTAANKVEFTAKENALATGRRPCKTCSP